MFQAKERAARRADRSGSGPTRSDAPPSRFPGATSWFALFGEVLLVGLLVALVSLPLVTLPVALVAGVRHLGRYLRAEDSALELFWRDVRQSLGGGILVGCAALGLALVLWLDLNLAFSGALPGGELIGAVGVILALGAVVGLFTAVGQWTPSRGWRGALRLVPEAVRHDPAGAAYLAAAGVFTVVVSWQLLPLVVPALGCVAFAIFAVPERVRRAR